MNASSTDASLTAKAHLAATGSLLASQPWFEAACTRWPAPIAHELARLAEMLRDGTDTGGCLFQVRDVAEVLLKTIALSFAADLLANCPSLVSQVSRQLLNGQMSLGSWLAMVRELQKLAPKDTGSAALLLPELRELTATGHPFYKSIEEYVPMRNRDIGHGAYRSDSDEIADRVRLQLLGIGPVPGNPPTGLCRAFAALAESGIWEDCLMRIGNPGGPCFTGAAAIDHERRHTPHEDVLDPLFLVRGDRSVPVSPLLARRRCSECEHVDSFVYEGPADWKIDAKTRIDFTDYAQGHRLRRNTDGDDALRNMVGSHIGAEIEARADGEFSSREVVRLLDDIMFDKRYMSPMWIREALAAHMHASAGGIFWLEAPAHIGKTMFLRGLVGDGLGENRAAEERELPGLAGDVFVLPVFLKREYNFAPKPFCRTVQNVLGQHFLNNTNYEFSIVDAETPEARQDNFVSFLQEARRGVRDVLGKPRLLIAIDGLDELPAPERLASGEASRALSAVDFLPAPHKVPDNVTILLTSRPMGDPTCPEWLNLRLGLRLSPGDRCVRMVTDVTTPGYVALLRDYVAKHSGFSSNHRRFDDVWHTIRDRSDGLFLFVSFLCDLIREATASDREQ